MPPFPARKILSLFPYRGTLSAPGHSSNRSLVPIPFWFVGYAGFSSPRYVFRHSWTFDSQTYLSTGRACISCPTMTLNDLGESSLSGTPSSHVGAVTSPKDKSLPCGGDVIRNRKSCLIFLSTCSRRMLAYCCIYHRRFNIIEFRISTSIFKGGSGLYSLIQGIDGFGGKHGC